MSVLIPDTKGVVSPATAISSRSQVRGFLAVSLLLGLVAFAGSRMRPPGREEGGPSWLSCPGPPSRPSCPASNFLQMGREEGGWPERGAAESIPGGHYPLAPLQISGFWKQMVPSARQIAGG